MKSPSGLRQPDLEPVAAEHADAGDRLRLAVDHRVGADDLVHVGGAAELILGFASRLKASTKLCAVTGAPVWKRNVRCSSKVYVRLSFETVNAFTTSGIEPRARRAWLVRVVEQLGAGRVLELPRIGVVRERRIDVVDVHVPAQPQRAALPRLPGCVRALGTGGTRETRCEQQRRRSCEQRTSGSGGPRVICLYRPMLDLAERKLKGRGLSGAACRGWSRRVRRP